MSLLFLCISTWVVILIRILTPMYTLVPPVVTTITRSNIQPTTQVPPNKIITRSIKCIYVYNKTYTVYNVSCLLVYYKQLIFSSGNWNLVDVRSCVRRLSIGIRPLSLVSNRRSQFTTTTRSSRNMRETSRFEETKTSSIYMVGGEGGDVCGAGVFWVIRKWRPSYPRS